MRSKKAYGKHRLVCYRHRSKIGGAVMSFGECEVCQSPISSACGSLPKLCNKCSVSLAQCAECRTPLFTREGQMLQTAADAMVDEMQCPVPCTKCGKFIELHDSKWIRDGVGREQGVCEDCFEEGDDE